METSFLGGKGDASWWTFSINQERGANGKAVKNEAAGTYEHRDYQSYLHLDTLLQCQFPVSQVPDERIFIITHQLIELVFKMMIFDLAVIAKSVETLLALDISPGELFHTCAKDEAFWQSALTASARLTFASKEVISMLLCYLSKNTHQEETFSSSEFQRFRAYLAPASGFQTAQFRLIQRALGKTNLLRIRLFPGDAYGGDDGKKREGLVSVLDALILKEQEYIAIPRSEHIPLVQVARLDDSIQRLVGRLAPLWEGEHAFPPVPEIEIQQVHHSIHVFNKMLLHRQRMQQMAHVCLEEERQRFLSMQEIFALDLMQAVQREKQRRQEFHSAHPGLSYLSSMAPQSPFLQVIKHLIDTDRYMHDVDTQESFLAVHLKLAKDRVNDLQTYTDVAAASHSLNSTGGGGTAYLGFMHKMLIPLFPALIACRS